VDGRASQGIIEATCETEDRLAVGADFDVAAAYPDLAECVLTSIAKDYEYAVREAIFAFANDNLTTNWRLGIDDDRVRVTDEWRRRPGLPVDLGSTYDRAAGEVLTGQIETCPEGCEDPVDLATLAPPADAGTASGPEASASPSP
jgi:basic membrane lipoprotein Med (substrate-binding protein (PBP1-ABC) superfamily)